MSSLVVRVPAAAASDTGAANVRSAEVLGGWAEFTLTPPSEYFLNCLRSVAEATAGNGE